MPSVLSVTTPIGSHAPEFGGRYSRKERRQPRGKLGRRQDAAHQVGLGDARREEVLAGRLVVDRTVAIVEVKLANLGDDHRGQCRISSAGVVEDQPKGERGLRVLAFANGVREFRQPCLEPRDHRRFERLRAPTTTPPHQALSFRAVRRPAAAARPVRRGVRTTRVRCRSSRPPRRRCGPV